MYCKLNLIRQGDEVKISIIVPIFNVEKYLKDCIESIVNQTYNNLEIILIDDGSTDNSSKICQDYADIDIRILVVRIENRGLSVARNTGLKNATGDYIMFLDGDDFITLNAIEDIVNILKTDIDIDIITGKMFAYYDKSNIKREEFIIDENNLIGKSGEEVLTYYFNAIPNIIWSACRSIYRREFFVSNKFLFTPNLTSEDLDLIPLVYISAKKIRSYDQPFYYYRQQRPNSIINTQNLPKFQDIIYIINKYEEIINSGIYSIEFSNSLLKRLSNIYASYLVLISEIDKDKRELAVNIFEEKKYLLKYSSGLKNKLIKNIVKVIGIKRSSLLYAKLKKNVLKIKKINFKVSSYEK